LLAAALALAASCSKETGGDVAVTAVSLSELELEMTLYGGSRQLVATVQPSNATDKTVRWSALDTTVARVDASGLVSPLKVGTTYIVATSVSNPSAESRCRVTVSDVEVLVTDIALDRRDITMRVGGDQVKITATAIPDFADNKNILWSSSDENVAVVVNGLVAPIGPGYAVIRAKAEVGSASNSCTVAVKSSGSKEVGVSGVSLDKSTLSIRSGETYQLSAAITPSDADNKDVIWSSGDEDVAMVVGGLVIAFDAGSTTVGVRTVDGGYTATCTVTVSDSE